MTGNFNPTTIDNLPGIWRDLLRHYGLDFECVLPAVVLKYDRATNIVTVQGAVNRITTSGEPVVRTEMEVPCFNPTGGMIGINFPLKPGDTGWVVASDRDSTFFKQQLGVADPNTDALHKYSFGFFLPDKISGFQIQPEDEGALVIQTVDGATRISIKDERVKITRNTVSVETNGFQVTVTTPSSSMALSDDGTISLKAPAITLDGMANVTTGATGVITLASVATVSNGIVTAIS